MYRGFRSILAAAIAAGSFASVQTGQAADIGIQAATAKADAMPSSSKAAHSYGYGNAVIEPGIRVMLNHAKIIKLSHAAATVIIGNPEIADATVRDSQTLVLTGRGFGQTNLVILDAGGNPIVARTRSESRISAADRQSGDPIAHPLRPAARHRCTD